MTGIGALRVSKCQLSMPPPAEGADLCSCLPPRHNRYADVAVILILETKHRFAVEGSLSNGVQDLGPSSSSLATRISAERA